MDCLRFLGTILLQYLKYNNSYIPFKTMKTVITYFNILMNIVTSNKAMDLL